MLTIHIPDATENERVKKFEALRLAPIKKVIAPGTSIMTLPDDDDADFVPAPGEEHGVVIGDSVLSMEPKMSPEAVDSVQYSTFYAQMIANQAYDKETHVVEWYKKYTEVMTFMGWNMTSFNFKEQTSNNASVDVDQIALKMLAAAAGPGAAGAVLMASIKAGLEGLQESKKAVSLFNKESASSKNGSFQLMPAGERSNGSPLVLLNSMYCSTKVNKGKILFVSWNKSEMRLWGNAQRMEQLPSIYKRIRSKVEDELADYLVQGFHEKFKLNPKKK